MELPIPDQLKIQLGKCKTVRDVDYHKSREKTAEVGVFFHIFCDGIGLYEKKIRFAWM